MNDNPKTSTALATGTVAVPAELLDATARDAGLGVSRDPEDWLSQIASVLQSNSPQVNKRGSDYMQDAEPGDWWLRGAANPISNGTDGIVVIPCGMGRSCMAWW